MLLFTKSGDGVIASDFVRQNGMLKSSQTKQSKRINMNGEDIKLHLMIYIRSKPVEWTCESCRTSSDSRRKQKTQEMTTIYECGGMNGDGRDKKVNSKERERGGI